MFISQKARLWKCDLSRASRLLPICPRDCSYIGMRWRNLLYFVMPMGLRLAAYVCQRVTNAITFIHREMGFWSINYLDDFGSAEPEDITFHSFMAMGNLLRDLGVKEASEKAVAPCPRMEFLGNTLDVEKQTIEVSDHRIQSLRTELSEIQQHTTIMRKRLQSIIGKLNFVTNCVSPRCIFISRLINLLKVTPENCLVYLDNESKKDMEWWEKFLPQFSGVSILWLNDAIDFDMWIDTDSCMDAAGGILKPAKEYFHHRYTDYVKSNTNSIAQREMFALLISLKLWASKLAGTFVKISCDNEATVWATSTGCTKNEFMLKCLREIARVSAKHSFMLKTRYLPGRDNILPDCLSRWYIDMNARRQFFRNTKKSQWTR